MAKKHKSENKLNDNTAFTKQDWFGSSRKTRQNKNKNKKNKKAVYPKINNHNRGVQEINKKRDTLEAETLALLNMLD